MNLWRPQVPAEGKGARNENECENGVCAWLLFKGYRDLKERVVLDGAHPEFLIIKVPNVVRQMGLKTPRSIRPCGVSSGAMVGIKCGSVISV